MMAAPIQIMVQKVQDVTVVDLQDARLLETHVIDEMGEQLYRLVDKLDRKKLVLDFSKVQFLSSAAIGVLLNLHKKSAAIKGTMVLCGLKKDILKVFEIMKLNKLLKICADEREALAVFGVNAG
jgi:anti-sigma B factor antagonist